MKARRKGAAEPRGKTKLPPEAVRSVEVEPRRVYSTLSVLAYRKHL